MRTKIVFAVVALLLVAGGISFIRDFGFGFGPEPMPEPEVVPQPTIAPEPIPMPSPRIIALRAVSLGKVLYREQLYEEARSLFAQARDMAPELNDPGVWIAGCDRRIDEQDRRVSLWASTSSARYTGGQAARSPARVSLTRNEARELRILTATVRMMERDRIRKWRYQHGLPTQNPTSWERLIGYADGDPW